MSFYLLRIGGELEQVLKRACAAQPEQVAGYVSNIDFWICEFAHLVEIVDGYKARLQRMRKAMSDFGEAQGGFHNIDDVGEPYQDAVSTSTESQRNELIHRCKSHLDNLIARSLKIDIIDFKEHDRLMDAVDLIMKRRPSNSTCPFHGRTSFR